MCCSIFGPKLSEWQSRVNVPQELALAIMRKNRLKANVRAAACAIFCCPCYTGSAVYIRMSYYSKRAELQHDARLAQNLKKQFETGRFSRKEITRLNEKGAKGVFEQQIQSVRAIWQRGNEFQVDDARAGWEADAKLWERELEAKLGLSLAETEEGGEFEDVDLSVT